MRTRLGTGWIVPTVFGAAALATGLHAQRQLAVTGGHPGSRAWLDVMYTVLRVGVIVEFTLFTVGRPAPLRRSRSPLAFAACMAAMGPVAIFGDPPAHAPDLLVLVGEVLAIAFSGWVVFSVAFLGRCFGVLPAARGLVTRGPYGVVRHPVYLGEIGASLALAIAAPTLRNGVLLLVLIAGQKVRMAYEERTLREAFPEYAGYARRVPGLIPVPRLRRLDARHRHTTLRAARDSLPAD